MIGKDKFLSIYIEKLKKGKMLVGPVHITKIKVTAVFCFPT